MNVRYIGRKTVDIFGDKLARPIEPTAIVSFKESDEPVAVAILEATGYSYDLFRDGDSLWAEIPVDSKEDFRDFMAEWKDGKEAYNL